MKKEYSLQFDALLKILVVCVFAVLYAMGGIEFKWIRRFLAPALVQGFCFWYTGSWKYLPQMALQFFSLSLGYGADTVGGKILRRAIFGAANGAAFWPWAAIKWDKSKWALVGFYLAVVIGNCIFFGVLNPFNNARTEETMIGLTIVLIPVLTLERKETNA